MNISNVEIYMNVYYIYTYIRTHNYANLNTFTVMHIQNIITDSQKYVRSTLVFGTLHILRGIPFVQQYHVYENRI